MRTLTSQSLIKSLLLVCAMLGVAATAFASPPPMFSYQGRLTDPGGSPVPDGVYSVDFQIWNAPVAGVSFWSSGPVSVTTTDGLFAIKLGQSPQPALPIPIFYDSLAYLGITVGVDPEISPRTQIVSSPYSLTTGTIESATGGRVFGNLYLSDGVIDYVQTDQFAHSFSTFSGTALEATRLWGNAYGEFDAFDNAGTQRVSLQAGFFDFPRLELTGVASSIILTAGVIGDNAAFFPDSAISSSEILDEPGLAQSVGTLNLTAPPGAYEDVVSVTITLPASGYVYLHADGESATSAPTGTSSVVIHGLGELSSVAPVSGAYFIGTSATPNLGTEYDQFSTSATFFKVAGTYTFYLTASRIFPTSFCTFYRARLKAIYLPTSYGPVTSPVPPLNTTFFSDAMSENDERTDAQMKLVDLRDLELKAAKLKAEATAAELALVKARNKQHTNTANAGTTTDDKR